MPIVRGRAAKRWITQPDARASTATNYPDWTIAALAVLLLATLLARWVYPHLLADLHPWPDAVEYAVGAANIVQYGRLVVWLNGQLLPSRYSPGFPLAIAPIYLLAGVHYTYAIFVVLGADLLVVGLTYALGRRLFGKTAGIMAAAIVALSPLDGSASQTIMSDIPASAVLIASMVALLYVRWGSQTERGRQRSTRTPAVESLVIWIAGCMFGYSVWIRQVNAAYLPAFLLLLVIGASSKLHPASGLPRRAWRPVASFLACFFVFQAGLMLYNLRTFGGVLRTGYNFWIPYLYDDISRTFSLDYAFGTAGYAMTYLKALVGRTVPEYSGGPPQAIYSSVVALLAVVGASVVGLRATRSLHHKQSLAEEASLWRLRFGFLVCSALVVLTAVGLYSVYFFYALRFLHVVVPLVAVFASVGLIALVQRGERMLGAALQWRPSALRELAAGSCALLICVQLARDVSASGWWQTTVFKRNLETERPVDVNTDTRASSAMQLIDQYTELDATIVEDVDPELFSAYQATSRRRLLLLDSEAAIPPSVNLGRLKDTPELLIALIARGAHVYFVGSPSDLVSLYRQETFAIEPIAAMQSRVDVVTLHRIAAGPDARSGTP